MISTDPSVVFVNQGANIFVVAQLLDEQGNQLPISFDATDVGSQISVVKDTTYLETTNGTKLNTRERFVVTGLAPGASSFTIAGGGLKDTVPVSVIPTSLAATFSTATPVPNVPVTITLPAGYTFSSDATVSTAAGTGFVTAIAPDGSSADALLPPGSTGVVTLGGVSADFLPGVPLSGPTIDSVTVAAVTPLTGTGATGTAPALTVAAVGGTSILYDGGTFDYNAPLFGTTIPARLYKFTVPADGGFTVTLDWPSSEDMGVYYFASDGTTEAGSPADDNGAGVHPESSTSTFTAGTYFMAVVNFSDTNPPYFNIQFTTEVPATGE
jgi:hypothetical protein